VSARGRVLDDLRYLARPPARAYPWTVVWRWRYELLAGCMLAAVCLVSLWSLAGLGLMAFGLWLLPGVGGQARDLLWVVVTPHRVRLGCVEAGVYSYRGRLPAVLRTRRAAYGEQVLLWCPAGTTGEDLAAATDVLRAACWAADVRVVPDPDRRQRVVLEVVRTRK
jgi:hypothetical protein